MEKHLMREAKRETDRETRQRDRYRERVYLVIWNLEFSSPFLDVARMFYVNSLFSCTARLWNSLPIECFPLTYNLNNLSLELADTY